MSNPRVVAVVLLAVMCATLLAVWCLVPSPTELEVAEPRFEAASPPSPQPLPASANSVVSNAPARAPSAPATSPSQATANEAQPAAKSAAPGASSLTGQPLEAAWLPPGRNDDVFDLNSDGKVGAGEQERADELLERANQFASNRSADGTFPILESQFRGERRFFRAVDENHDGALSEREFLVFETESIRQLRRFDQNADGALTPSEFGHLASRFDFLDEDHDGLLWAWEITLMRGRGKW